MKKFFLMSALLTFCATAHADYYESGCCDWGIFEVGADWLYWKTYQDNLEFAALVNFAGDDGVDIVSSTIGPKFDFNSGFRIFAGFERYESDWHLEAIYTRITSNETDGIFLDPDDPSVFITLNNANFPVFNIVTSTIMNLSSISSNWNSRVNFFDIDLSYKDYCYHGIDITPHFGLRGLWIRQTLNLDGMSTLGDFTSNFEQEYDGYGLEAGLNASIPLCYGFSIQGHLGGSLLYARIQVDEAVTILISPTDMGMVSVNNQIHHLSPTIDGFIGLSYDNHCFRFPFNLHVGWEQHIVFNSNHFSIFNYSDLTLQGLTLGGSIAF